jgi:hypothetical protein
VFAVKGYGFRIPYYVGSATKRSLGSEALSDRNIALYQDCMADYRKGTPVLYFLISDRRHGKSHQKHILECEKFLIQLCSKRNPKLLNVKGTKGPKWGIKGVLRSGRKVDAAALELEQVLGWDKTDRKRRKKT